MGHEEQTSLERAVAGGAMGVVRSFNPRLLLGYVLALTLLGGCVGIAALVGSDDADPPPPDLRARAELVRADDSDVRIEATSRTLEVRVPVMTTDALSWLRQLVEDLDLPLGLADRMASTTAADGSQQVQERALEVTWEQVPTEGLRVALRTEP